MLIQKMIDFGEILHNLQFFFLIAGNILHNYLWLQFHLLLPFFFPM